jgi:phosphoribosylaminoimidazole carboxylase
LIVFTGGGQLGRMLAAAASQLNVDVIFLDADHSPAKQVVASRIGHVDGSFTDAAKIKELASKVDVLTIEIEHVGVACLEEIQKQGKVSVHPRPSTIRIIQDKLKQKQHLASHGAPVLEFMQVDSSPESILEAAKQLGYPLMLKSRTFAYDGRGNFVLRSPDQATEGISFLKGRQLYAEKWVHFAKEVAVIVVRTTSGGICSYPAVETVHKENICHLVFAPLRSRDASINARAQDVAESAVKHLEGAGVFAVEMFMMENGE